MQLFSKNKAFVAIFFFIVGVAVTTAYFKQNKNTNSEARLGNLYNPEFFDNLFNEHTEEMHKEFNSPSIFKQSFDTWYKNKFGDSNVSEMKQHEDDKYLYYEIEIKGLTPQRVDVEVKDEQVFISGIAELKEENKYQESEFQRSFPVPQNVDANKFEMEQNGKKIVIKFPKL